MFADPLRNALPLLVDWGHLGILDAEAWPEVDVQPTPAS